MNDISGVAKTYVPTIFANETNKVSNIIGQYSADVSAMIETKLATLPDAEKAQFLSMIQSGVIDLTPGGAIDKVEVQDALDRLAVVAGMLSDLSETFGDITALLAALMIQQAADQRKQALQDRLTSREQAKAQLMEQANKMRESAQEMKTGAAVAFAVSLVMAVASAALSGVSMAKSINTLGKLKEARTQLKDYETNLKAYQDDLKAGGQNRIPEPQKPDLSVDLEFIKNIDTRAGHISSFAQTLGQIGMNASNFAATWSQAASKELDAAGQIFAALAQDLDMVADIKKDIFNGLDELVRAIIGFLKDMAESEAELARSFTRV